MNTGAQDAVVAALSSLVPSGVDSGELTRESGRHLRWVAAGTATPPVVLVQDRPAAVVDAVRAVLAQADGKAP
ncbi:hypothetical protein AB0283_05535 [Micromonospora vinacea]|uniref:hypothetical protein n=1 Tax=Micromonospora vinacea TaxID=709878 RepID=UPI00344B0741